MQWYIKVLRQYADFSGRARRMEFWMFLLFNYIFWLAAVFLDRALGVGFFVGYYGPTSMLYSLFVFIPNLAVVVRRLHDIGKSGWMYFIIFIPIIGWIWFFVLMLRDSQPGENQYGHNPKEGDTGLNTVKM